jgi:hypothetical protein
VPEAVYRTALEALHDDITESLGVPAIVTPWIRNNHMVSSLQAFIEQPYAPNVITLRPFIGNRFDELFSHLTQDDFDILSEQFCIEESDELRMAYTHNPYAIVIYLLMRQLRLANNCPISMFLDLADSFLGVKLRKFRFDWEKKSIAIESRTNYIRSKCGTRSCMLDDVSFFINWLAEQKNTADIPQYLFQGCIRCTQPGESCDFFEIFHEYFPYQHFTTFRRQTIAL